MSNIAVNIQGAINNPITYVFMFIVCHIVMKKAFNNSQLLDIDYFEKRF